MKLPEEFLHQEPSEFRRGLDFSGRGERVFQSLSKSSYRKSMNDTS